MTSIQNLKALLLSPKEIKNKPWLNTIILKMIKIRNKVFHRKKRQPNNDHCKRLYNLLRNRINRELKKIKKTILRVLLH